MPVYCLRQGKRIDLMLPAKPGKANSGEPSRMFPCMKILGFNHKVLQNRSLPVKGTNVKVSKQLHARETSHGYAVCTAGVNLRMIVISI